MSSPAVKVGQVWASDDPRDRAHGVRQDRRVVALDALRATLATMPGGRHSSVSLDKRGPGTTIAGHRLLHDAALGSD